MDISRIGLCSGWYFSDLKFLIHSAVWYNFQEHHKTYFKDIVESTYEVYFSEP